MKIFRELYCERYGIASGKFERHLVWRCLHWPARPIFWLHWLNPELFEADFEFARSVGELRSRSGYHAEAAEFHYHPKNRKFLRTVLGLRVSSQRMQRIFEREFTGQASNPPVEVG